MARVYTRKHHIGEKHGRLTILEDLPDLVKNNLKIRIVSVSCDCGSVYESRLHGILNGSVRSCGCGTVDSARKLCVERNTTHGDSGSKEYNAWKGMKQRCYNTKGEHYHLYGGRGIVVDTLWVDDYSKFLSDMGRAPETEDTWTVGRKDNNAGYSSNNCVWEVWDEQARNRGMQINNTSGVTGVYEKVRNGYVSFAAKWYDITEGKVVEKSFSSIKYGGDDKAFNLAVACRNKAIEDMNLIGAGYSAIHGKPRKNKEQNEQN